MTWTHKLSSIGRRGVAEKSPEAANAPFRTPQSPRAPSSSAPMTPLINDIELLLQNSNEDEISATYFFQSDGPDALSRAEIIVGHAGLLLRVRGHEFDYANVIRIVHEFSGQPISIGLVYKAIDRLIERGIVEEVIETDRAGRKRSRCYLVTEDGQIALRLAALNSRVLAKIADRTASNMCG